MMETSVNILGTDVDILSNDVFVDKVDGFLTNDKLQVIFFVSAEILERASKEEEYRKCIDMAELCLPGEEESLFDSYHIETLKAGDIVVSCKSFGLLLENLKKQNRSVYIISDTEKNVELLEQYCKKMQPELLILGVSVYTKETDSASVVNEINSHIPDILLVNLPVGEQEKWIMEHLALLNAKICIAIGGVAELILFPAEKFPKWVNALHLKGLYRRIKKCAFEWWTIFHVL